MSIRRKSHNLDEELLRRAQRVLGAPTETATIHEALRAVLVGEEALNDLLEVRGKVRFRDGFAREMRSESKRR